MSKKKFKWWWQDKKELALWKKLNSMTKEEFSKVDKNLIRELKRKYGNIYFFTPFPKQEEIINNLGSDTYIHGNNASGKSYTAAYVTASQCVGFSPYFDVDPPKYGDRVIWAFSPSFDIQRTSSQVHLFSTDTPNDVGLLPSLDYIQKMGGKVAWGKNKCLDFVRFPDGTMLEFKSAEMQTFNLQASGIDFCWFDEFPPQKMHDEILARLVRKNGKMIMSFLVEDPFNHYIVKDIYNEYKDGKKPNVEFHFMSIEDNLSMTAEEMELAKARVSPRGREWRFSEGGKFALAPRGELVYEDFSEIHITEGLITQHDPLRILWRAWDLGFAHPACVAMQLDKNKRMKFMFADLGEKIQLSDFIDQVEASCKELMPDIQATYEILPHDANRHYDIAPDNAADIFRKKGFRNFDVTYAKKEASIVAANEKLREIRKGEPVVQVDPETASILVQCLQAYSRDENTLMPKDDDYYKHVSDAFKLMMFFFDKESFAERIEKLKEPNYNRIRFGRAA